MVNLSVTQLPYKRNIFNEKVKRGMVEEKVVVVVVVVSSEEGEQRYI